VAALFGLAGRQITDEQLHYSALDHSAYSLRRQSFLDMGLAGMLD
jgi:hypothetical protein